MTGASKIVLLRENGVTKVALWEDGWPDLPGPRYDITEADIREMQARRTFLEGVFHKRGIAPDHSAIFRLASMGLELSIGAPTTACVADPAGQTALDKVETSIQKTLHALAELDRASRRCKPGRRNIAHQFLSRSDNPREALLNALKAVEAVKRDGHHATATTEWYDDFIGQVLEAAGSKTIGKREAFIQLLGECEFILPAELRSKNKSAVADRYQACRERLRRRNPPKKKRMNSDPS